MLALFAQLDPTTRLIVVIAFVSGLYVLSVLVWPYTGCPTCSAAGKHHSPNGANFRLCRQCKGSGKKVRLLARLLRRP